MTRIDVGVLGATGRVGQEFLALLSDHPWFDVTWIAASDRSAGKLYRDIPWRLGRPRPDRSSSLRLEDAVPGRAPQMVFSALDAAAARDIESAFAAAGHTVITNASSFRMDPTVPLLVPEINASHLALLDRQQREKNWQGAIIANPNCSTVFLAMALGALKPFQPSRAVVCTLQALSGAGYPGVASLDATANVIPFIGGEEPKIESETKKILGEYTSGAIADHPVTISATTTRVPVIDGHTELISVSLDTRPTLDAVREALRSFASPVADLPSAPRHPIRVTDEPDRPQPRLDVNIDGGMSVIAGRFRECPVLGYKFVALGHNTVRGAAGAAILNAELLVTEAQRSARGVLELRAGGV
jgi:aspartate-semialdehyde dehydrogenase